MKIAKIALAACALLIPVAAFALKIDTSTIKSKNVFGISFPDGGSIFAKSGSVVSISKHEFIAGPLFVSEVCIDLAGSTAQVRIYNSRTISADMVSDIASDKLPDELKPYAKVPSSVKTQLNNQSQKLQSASSQPKVYKDYPMTTHAHTVEYVVPDIDELEKLYTRLMADYIGNLEVKAATGTSTSSASQTVVSSDILPALSGKLYIVEKGDNSYSAAGFGGKNKKKNK